MAASPLTAQCLFLPLLLLLFLLPSCASCNDEQSKSILVSFSNNVIEADPGKKKQLVLSAANDYYLYLEPEKQNVVYSILVSFCRSESNGQFQIIPMVDTSGSLPSLSVNQLEEVPDYEGFTEVEVSSDMKCLSIQQMYIKFEEAANGKIEQFVLKLQSNNGLTIDVIIEMEEFVNNRLVLILGLVLFSITIAILIAVVVYCCYRRMKRRREEEEKMNYKEHMLDHIRNQMPALQAKDMLFPKLMTCTICLCDYQPEQKVRKLVCAHIFHEDCIDSWCMKNLSCPVCRFSLDQESIKRRKEENAENVENSNRSIKWSLNPLSARDEPADIYGPNDNSRL